MPKYFGLESVPINQNEGFGRKKKRGYRQLALHLLPAGDQQGILLQIDFTGIYQNDYFELTSGILI